MNLLKIFGTLRTLGRVVEARNELKAARIDAETIMTEASALARADAIGRGDVEAEALPGQGQSPANSWLDEFWSVVLASPLVGLFIPGLQEHVALGFELAADIVPDWYQWGLAAAISFAFARRAIPAGLEKLKK